MKRDVTRYFDHNATAVPLSGLVALSQSLLTEGPLNPSSVHGYGRRAKAILEQARRSLAAEIGTESEHIRFTSGATEAISDFMEGYLTAGDHVLVNPLEHSAVLAVLDKVGARVEYMTVDRDGQVDVDEVVGQVKPDTKLVVLMRAHNELGNLYPVQELCQKLSPIPVFCDAVQALGKVPVDVEMLGIAGAVFSAHKVGGLSGVGALWTRRGLDLSPRTRGGSQERGERGGTENLLGAASFRLAIEHLAERRNAQERLQSYRDLLVERLSAVKGFTIFGAPTGGLSNTLFFRVEGVPGDLVVQAMDLEGFCLSTGSACSSGSVEPSKTLLAMGWSRQAATEGVRISMGPETTKDSVVMLADVLADKLHGFSLS